MKKEKRTAYISCMFIEDDKNKIRLELVFAKKDLMPGEGETLLDENGDTRYFLGEDPALRYLFSLGWRKDIFRYDVDSPRSKMFETCLKKEVTSEEQIKEGIYLKSNNN